MRQYTSEPVTEPTTLRVYRGADGQFTLYEDDGISLEYLQGKGSWTRIVWNDREGQLTIEPGAPRGASNVVAERAFKVQVLPDGATRQLIYSGKRVQAKF